MQINPIHCSQDGKLEQLLLRQFGDIEALLYGIPIM